MATASIEIMPSSWIRDIKYSYITGRLDINMKGKWYGPWYVDSRRFENFINGRAVCVTTDPTGRRRWQRGDTPSLGAAFHRWIKVGGGPGVVRRLGARITALRRGIDQDILGALGRAVGQGLQQRFLGQLSPFGRRVYERYLRLR